MGLVGLYRSIEVRVVDGRVVGRRERSSILVELVRGRKIEREVEVI